MIKHLKHIIYIIISSGVLLFLLCCNTLFASQTKQKVYVVPVSGPVEPSMAVYIKRAVKSIKNDHNAVFVFKIDTFGGRVDTALDIVDTISTLPEDRTISFVEKRAISAGALIALSSGLLFMKHNTIIGDCAPIINTSKGMKMAGEKIQTVLRAKFRSLAKRNKYPVLLAQSMVSLDLEVYKVIINGKTKFMEKKAYDDLSKAEKEKIKAKKTIVAKGELLTMDDTEAFDLGFSRKSVNNLKEALSFAGYNSLEIMTIEPSWSEKLVRFLTPFLPLLMLIGIGAVYTEIKVPGFGVPGMIGIICLGIVFFNQFLTGLADQTELLLLIIGVLLLGTEIFVIPGFGVAGISGLVMIAAGLVLSFQSFVLPDPSLPWQGELFMKNLAYVLGSFLFAFLVSLFVIRFVLPGFAKIVKGPYLNTTLKNSYVDTAEKLQIEPGDIGIAHTFLRPSGKIIINNRKIDAITRGEFIERGKPVVIDSIEQNHVIVRLVNS